MKRRVFGADGSPVMRGLASRVGGRDLLKWIEERAATLANLGRTREGAVQVNRRVRDACRVDSVRPDSMTARAELKADGTRYAIRFNRVMSQEVQRFSIAHEIGHTLWISEAAGRSIPGPSGTVGVRDETIEMLCDYFAGAFLMPVHDVKQLVREHVARRASGGEDEGGREFECPVELIPSLAGRFKVQRRIAAWRLLLVQELDSWAVIRVERSHVRLGGLPFWEEEQEPETWEATWYETGTAQRKLQTVDGYAVPFGAGRRRIPADMMPAEPYEDARPQLLDSRWWDGVKPQPAGQAKVPFRLRKAAEPRVGVAARTTESMYIALNRGQGSGVLCDRRCGIRGERDAWKPAVERGR